MFSVPDYISRLRITDGQTSVDLTGTRVGFKLVDWRPAVPGAKDGGVWASSPFTDGRRIVARQHDNITDEFMLAVNSQQVDLLIRTTQDLRRLLEKAVSYWTTTWQDEPVWIEARGIRETNTRYAVIVNYETPSDANPFADPMAHPGSLVAMDDWVLKLEHLIWQSTVPGTGDCVPIKSGDCYDWPKYGDFDGAASRISLASPALLDNLADNAFTVEAWIKADAYGEGNAGRIMDKEGAGANVGWKFFITNTNGLEALVRCAVTNATAQSGLDEFTADGEWHHVAMTWDDAADRKIYLYIDGVPVASYAGQVTGNGAIVADAAVNLYIGNDDGSNATFDGGIGWCRISNHVRYSFIFNPPARCLIPDDDVNTLWLGLVEGTGTTIYDRSGNGNNGTAASMSWLGDCCE